MLPRPVASSAHADIHARWHANAAHHEWAPCATRHRVQPHPLHHHGQRFTHLLGLDLSQTASSNLVKMTRYDRPLNKVSARLPLLARDAVSAARNAGHLASPVWEISEDATMPGRIYSIAPAVSMCQCTSLPARQIGAALSTDRPTTADTPGGRHVRQEIGQNQSLFGSKGIFIH